MGDVGVGTSGVAGEDKVPEDWAVGTALGRGTEFWPEEELGT